MGVSAVRMSTGVWPLGGVSSATTAVSAPVAGWLAKASCGSSSRGFGSWNVATAVHDLSPTSSRARTLTHRWTRLRSLYESVLSDPRVVGLAIGTRPDCVPDEVLNLLSELAERTYVCLEYGLQSIHDRSLDWMNRGHDYAAFLDAMQRSRDRGFDICAHVIVGLPGESHDDIMATADELARLQVDSVKIHNLYVVKNTALADQLQRGEIVLMDRPTYVRTVVDFLERLPPNVVVERVSSAAPREFFVAPDWSLDKSGTLAALQQEFARRHTFQGCRW